MKKHDLKDGMICEQRDGSKWLWLAGMLRRGNSFCSGTLEDLTNCDYSGNLDIIAVYAPQSISGSIDDLIDEPGLCIWTRRIDD